MMCTKKWLKKRLTNDEQWLGVNLKDSKQLEQMCRKVHDGIGSPSMSTMSRQMISARLNYFMME